MRATLIGAAARLASPLSISARRGQRLGILATLVVVLVATRADHFGFLPDATLAVFFLAGLYVGRARWVLPLLMLCALACDYFVITGAGQSFWSHYCVSAAYGFLIPAYASMWLGGAWLGRHLSANLRGLALGAAALLASFTLSFIFSNGSFYWLSGRYVTAHWTEFIEQFVTYYPAFVRSTLSYAVVAAVLHALTLQLPRYLPRPSSHLAGR